MFEEEMKILQDHKETVKTAVNEMCRKFGEALEAISKFEHIDKEMAVVVIGKSIYDGLEKLAK